MIKKFSPIIQLIQKRVPDGEVLVVLFDSNSDDDWNRAPVLTVLPATFKSLTVEVMQDTQSELDVGRGTYGGHVHITLVADYGDGSRTTCPLAKCCFLTGHFDGAERIVRTGTAEAFSLALDTYLAGFYNNGSHGHDTGQADPPFVRQLPPHTTSGGVGPFSFWKSKGVAGAVTAAVLMGALAMLYRDATPIEAAVANAMAQDPAAITAQVELTKQTLKQMGLDPGAAGDLGCLAPR